MLRLSLRTKLILSTLVVLVPVLGLLIQDYRATYEAQKNLVLADQIRVAQIVSVLVDDAFDEGLTVAQSLTIDPVILTFERNRIDDHLSRLALIYPDFDSIGVFDARGELIGSAAKSRQANVADRQWFRDAIGAGKPVVSGVVISRGTGNPIVSIAAPIVDQEGKQIGAVAAALSVNSVPEALQTVQRAERQHIFLADRTGRLAFHTGRTEMTWEERNVGEYPPVRTALEGKVFQAEQLESLLGDQRMVTAISTPRHGWVVGVSVPVEVALAQLQRSLWFSLLVFAGVVVLSLALSLALARLLLDPLKRLADHALALGRGDLQQRVQIATGDELESLGDAFNAMAGELQRALRLREEFLTVAAHELRTPLTIIKGYSQWLMSKEGDEEKRKRFRTIVEQTNRIGELVDEMLTVSEMRGGRFELHKERIDLAGLAREVVDRMQLMTDQHRLIYRGEQEAPVEADRNQMEVVLTNLVDNAMRYSPQGGDIEVAVTKGDGEVIVSVRDQGLGIADEKQKHVFEPFFQIYPAIAGYGGLGLGLFISKEIVERHGGRIWFQSTEDKGSTFYFSIPRSA